MGVRMCVLHVGVCACVGVCCVWVCVRLCGCVLCVGVCACVRVCCVWVGMCTCVCIWGVFCVCVQVCLHACVSVLACVCMSVCMCGHVCVCVCVCVQCLGGAAAPGERRLLHPACFILETSATGSSPERFYLFCVDKCPKWD